MTIAHAKDWQRERALILHNAFIEAKREIELEGRKLLQALAGVHGRVSARVLSNGKFLRVGNLVRGRSATLVRAWYDWQSGGCKPEALLQEKKGFAAKMTPELVREFQRRCTMPGCMNFSAAIKSLKDDWSRGEHVPGLGDRFEWCFKHGLNANEVPEFPISDKTFYRWKPSKRERALGTRGVAAMRQVASFVDMDYSKLRKCELFTLDDVRLDIICIDERTGYAVEVVCYILMEVASRSIVAWLMKPANAIKQEDVDELVAYGLQCEGYGIGKDYVTHIKFERGTVACSESAKLALEGASEGRIKIHRTSMDGGVRWIGAPADKASGHAAGKAVIESFNRKLHLALMNLPGQRGNKFENQPSNLGYVGPKQVTPGSLIAEAQKIDRFNFLSGGRCRLNMPMLYLMELHKAVRDAIDKHNHEDGHDYNDHGTFAQAEVAPGVWKETQP